MSKYSRKFRSNLIESDTYNGFSVMASKGPFVATYLDRLIQVMDDSLVEHPRTFAVRFDLQIPKSRLDAGKHRLIDRFISSLKGKVKRARLRAADEAKNRWAHGSAVRYVWAREVTQNNREHYHFVLFLNRDAFNAVGSYSPDSSNLYSRLLEAWASALGVGVDEVCGLVHVPRNATYWVTAGDEDSQDELIYRASYLAKVATKKTGSRHSFGFSRSRYRQGQRSNARVVRRDAFDSIAIRF